MSDKRFPPSAQRLKRARREGKVVKSQLVAIAANWLGLLSLFLIARSWVRIGTLVHWFEFKVLSPEGLLVHALHGAFVVTLLCVGWIALVSTLVGLFQTRGLFVPSQIVPDVGRLRPSRYFGRLNESGVDGVMGLIRIACLVAASAPLIVLYVGEAGLLFGAPTDLIIYIVRDRFVEILVRGVIVLGMLGLSSYGLRWLQFLRRHRMSLEELKEEHRQSEGDPHFRALRRSEHRMMAMAEIEKRVKNSRVLIVRRQPVMTS